MMGVPLALLLGAAAWKAVEIDPRWRAERGALMSARTLQAETERLRLACSESEAAEIHGRAAALRAVVPTASQVIANGERWVSAAAEAAGWVAASAHPECREGFAQWDVLLRPKEQNSNPWRSLVALEEGLQGRYPQMGLTRLTVRADEEGRYSAESSMRLPYLLPDEEISQ